MQLIDIPTASSPSFSGWRKSSRSNPSGNCVELRVILSGSRGVVVLTADPVPPHDH
jgi:Domain of unknown function (DUF397)